ncbi:MAG: PRC-barrel domain protein [Methanomassiliicoccales archaeon PtaU1.Bin124]|nr:MAG: PRC-barrel domain protein [Methanomassiliicoccales archaeon PtaU1.Bin124]
MINLQDLIGKEVMSANAKLVGKVDGAAVDVKTWHVPAISITISKGNEAFLNKKKKVISSQGAFVKVESIRSIKDHVMLSEDLENMANLILEDFKAPVALSDMMGDRVLCKAGREIGTVYGFQVDNEGGWNVPYMEVLVDKASMEELNVKKKFGKKPIIVLRTSDIKNVADVILLDIEIEQVKQFLDNKPVARVR